MTSRRALRGSALGLLAFTLVGTVGCSQVTPIKTVDFVDLQRFMGEWYVIAAIPTPLERNVYNPIESYELNDKGEIETTFTYYKGGFDGPKKTMRPKGFVRNTETNADWGMQFIWPIKAEYRIIYLDDDYTRTVVGRSKRDYLWIMARTPEISDADYQALVQLADDVGYDIDEIQKMPQRWDE